MKCIWHFISYSAMQFAFWPSLYNRIRERGRECFIEGNLNSAVENIFKMTGHFTHLNWLHCSATKISECHLLFHAIIGDIKYNFTHVPEVSCAGSTHIKKKVKISVCWVRSGGFYWHFSASLSAECFLIFTKQCSHVACKIPGYSVLDSNTTTWAAP